MTKILIHKFVIISIPLVFMLFTLFTVGIIHHQSFSQYGVSTALAEGPGDGPYGDDSYSTGIGDDTASGVGDDTSSGVGDDTTGSNSKIINPLKVDTITKFLMLVIEVLLIFALPIIVLFIIYAGFLFVTARGDTGQIQTAKSALLWAVVGGVIVLGAKLIITVICGTVGEFGVTTLSCSGG